jgi:hypothetical protein
VLLAVEGHPVELGQVALPNLPRILLSPLTEEEADDLLTVPVRGHLAYDFEAIGRIIAFPRAPLFSCNYSAISCSSSGHRWAGYPCPKWTRW